FSQYLEEYISDYVSTDFREYLPEIIRMGVILVFTGIVIFIFISVILSLVRTLLRFFDFRAWLEEDVIGISSGLFKKVEYRIPVSKVQYLVWASNPLRKILGFQSIQVKQAQPQQAGRRNQQAIEIPACYEQQSRALEEVVFKRKVSGGPNLHHANVIPYLFLSAYAGIAISGVLIFATSFSNSPFWAALLIIPFIIFLGYKYGQSVSIDWQDDVIIINKGWIFPRRYVLPAHKAQSVSMVQSMFLKRRGLADFVFYTASGRVGIRFLPEDLATELYNFILYRTENHHGSWM
ncbi:MAG: PH domain-containing protein, partial [Cyclobacteriaceae bacterium]